LCSPGASTLWDCGAGRSGGGAYLSEHIDNESLVTDQLVDYIHRAHNWSPEFIEARRQSVSLPHDDTQDLAGI